MHFFAFIYCVHGEEKTIPLKIDTHRGWSGMKCLQSIGERWLVGSNRSGGEAFAIHSLTMEAISEYRLLHAHSTPGSEFCLCIVCMYVCQYTKLQRSMCPMFVARPGNDNRYCFSYRGGMHYIGERCLNLYFPKNFYLKWAVNEQNMTNLFKMFRQ